MGKHITTPPTVALPPEVSPAQPAAPRHDVESDLGQEGGPIKGQPEPPGEVG